jgi:hypothetical protein
MSHVHVEKETNFGSKVNNILERENGFMMYGKCSTQCIRPMQNPNELNQSCRSRAHDERKERAVVRKSAGHPVRRTFDQHPNNPWSRASGTVRQAIVQRLAPPLGAGPADRGIARARGAAGAAPRRNRDGPRRRPARPHARDAASQAIPQRPAPSLGIDPADRGAAGGRGAAGPRAGAKNAACLPAARERRRAPSHRPTPRPAPRRRSRRPRGRARAPGGRGARRGETAKNAARRAGGPPGRARAALSPKPSPNAPPRP